MAQWEDNMRASFNTERITLDEAGNRSTAAVNGLAKSISGKLGGLFFLNITAVSGTSPSLTVKLQTSDDGGTNWYDLPGGGFTAATGVSKQVLQLNNKLGDTIRAVSAISGTSPSFSYTVKAIV